MLPIFAEHCYTCHGPDKAGRKANLQLDRREEALAERKSGGHAILPGEAGESLLMQRIGSGDPDEVMPPPESGQQLTADQIETLRRWIDAGADYEPHWSFVPPDPVAPPKIAGAAHPVDRFVLARLEEEGIAPSPEAPRATLIRRVTLDLTGLPPTREEVDAFLEDTRPKAYDHLVDRLLASPHFGEKWARWWLDLAHYGDSDGIRLDNARPDAWRFREWVVDALNDDLPFDQFTIRQLAGDLLANASVSQRLATGFLRNTVSDRQTGNADPELGRVRQVVNRTSTVGAVWLGLTMECAECHDHKFDPVSQKDFFQLYAFFNGAEEMNINAPLPGEMEKHRPARRVYERKRAELIAPLATRLDEMQAEWEERMLWTERNPGADHAWGRAFELLVTSWGRGRGEGQFEGLMIIKTPPGQRSAQQKERLQDYFLKNGRVVAPEAFAKLKIVDLSKELETLAREVPPLSRAQAMTQLPEPPVTRIHLRGDFRRPGETVTPGTPAVLPPLKTETSATPTRLDLAKWLVSPNHPLTARVTVNRLWQELFGSGLVPTSDNLGTRGATPTHPDLLDWLATQFPERGWSLKEVLRVMVTSDTYRQSSDDRSALSSDGRTQQDPGNALLARQAKLRLSAEGVRDNALAVGGLLNPTVGGPSVRPPQPESVTRENTRNPWKADEGEARYRRGLYTFIQRLTPFVQFANFDLPGSTTACSRRERSNTPLQALNLLNDPAFVEAAHGLASRVCREVEADESARLEHAFVLALARRPSPEEAERLGRHLREQTALFETAPEAADTLAPDPFPDTSAAASAAWVTLASVLMNLHEFIHRE
ncbi:MAG: PSD1 and planctomycete cytochrome C domain-containing protein [Verrucomicrobiales bacterium]